MQRIFIVVVVVENIDADCDKNNSYDCDVFWFSDKNRTERMHKLTGLTEFRG